MLIKNPNISIKFFLLLIIFLIFLSGCSNKYPSTELESQYNEIISKAQKVNESYELSKSVNFTDVIFSFNKEESERKDIFRAVCPSKKAAENKLKFIEKDDVIQRISNTEFYYSLNPIKHTWTTTYKGTDYITDGISNTRCEYIYDKNIEKKICPEGDPTININQSTYKKIRDNEYTYRNIRASTDLSMTLLSMMEMKDNKTYSVTYFIGKVKIDTECDIFSAGEVKATYSFSKDN